MPFWWLNSLMKKGHEKPLEEKDMPLLRQRDRAESCYNEFMEQWNKQKQTKSSRSLLWTIVACYKHDILVSAFFALMKIITVSSSPVLIKAFINVTSEFSYWFHQTWTTSLQLCFALIILYNAVGLAMTAAFAVILLTRRYAWDTHFKKVIEGLRSVECKWLSAVQLRRSYNNFLFWSSPVLVSAATFLSCYLLHVPLNASNVFTFVATLRLVQDPVAFSRIYRFLDAPELQNGHFKRQCDSELEHVIIINSCSFSWDGNQSKLALKNIDLEVNPGEKFAICGEVGAGKSSLLAEILGEIPKVKGTIQVCGNIAYVSQTAWIQTVTVRDNILVGSPMDCSLVKDIKMLPFGDPTEIGERGNYVMGALPTKTVVLVTHQVDFLPAFNCILAASQRGNQILRREFTHSCKRFQKNSKELSGFHQLIKKEERETGDTGRKPYLQRLNQNKGYLYAALATPAHIIFLAGQISQNSWMASNVQNPHVSSLRLISVYLATGFSATIFLFARSALLVVLGLQSSKSLFSQLLNSLFQAPMLFFDLTPIGRILSRVSSDLSIVNLDVPFSFMLGISNILSAFSNLGVLLHKSCL
ncbi:putative ABC-type xenobiotic transporter [Dioscorea sansibarensis]